MTREVPEKHIINFLWPNESLFSVGPSFRMLHFFKFAFDLFFCAPMKIKFMYFEEKTFIKTEQIYFKVFSMFFRSGFQLKTWIKLAEFFITFCHTTFKLTVSENSYVVPTSTASENMKKAIKSRKRPLTNPAIISDRTYLKIIRYIL